MKEKITLKLSIDEIRVVFKALGKLPFAEVYEVIGDINKQVNEQVGKENTEEQIYK